MQVRRDARRAEGVAAAGVGEPKVLADFEWSSGEPEPYDQRDAARRRRLLPAGARKLIHPSSIGGQN